MSNGTKGSFGNNLTSILVALIGAVSAIGGAWITTYGTGSASQAAPAPAVTISNDAARAANPIDSASSGSVASAVPQASAQNAVVPVQSASPQSHQPNVAAPNQNPAPVFLPNSKQIAYNQPWPSDSQANHLILQTVELADTVVRVHLLFDNTSGNTVRFYTSLDGQGIRSYVYDKKEPKYPATSAGGELFADPTVVEIPAGTRKQGWLEYNTGGEKLGSVNLYLESYIEGYPAGQSGVLKYHPLKLKVGK